MEEPQLISQSREPYRHLVRLAALDKLELQVNSLKGRHRPVADSSTATRDLSEERRLAKLYCQWMRLDFEKSFAADVWAELTRITKLARPHNAHAFSAPRTSVVTNQAATPVAVNRGTAPIQSYTPVPVPPRGKSSLWFWLGWLVLSLVITLWTADDMEPARSALLFGSIMLIAALIKTYSWFEKRKARKSNAFQHRDHPPRY